MEKLKILQVVGAMNRAGTETMLMNIYRKLNHENVQFDFISYSEEDADYDDEIRALGGKIIKLTKTFSIKEIYDVIMKHGPYDAVHAHTLFHSGIASVAAYLAGVKIRIAHAHTTLDDKGGIFGKMYRSLMRHLIARFTTNQLACSKQAGNYLFGEEALYKRTYQYFPNALDYFDFLKAPRLEIAKFKVEEGLGNSIVIGHIGRFIEAKNHAFLLEMMKHVIQRDPTIKLLLVGDGDTRKQIEKLAKDEGILENVRFVGKRNDISTLLHSMDVFVFPSLYEGLGMVLLEAQACGIPCIVSEAIQPEADLNIGLVTRLTLADGAEVWADRAIALAKRKERNIHKISEGFVASGYSLEKGIATLLNLYNPKAGGAYERDLNRHF